MVLPVNNISRKTLQGIIMLPKLQQLVLTDSKTYQHYMAADNVIKKTMILLHDSIAYKWMIELFSSEMNSGLTMFANISILTFTIYFVFLMIVSVVRKFSFMYGKRDPERN